MQNRVQLALKVDVDTLRDTQGGLLLQRTAFQRNQTARRAVLLAQVVISILSQPQAVPPSDRSAIFQWSIPIDCRF